MSDGRRTIIAAAISYPEGVISVPAPGRHHDVIHLRFPTGGRTGGADVQGFVTSDGAFVDRKEGARIALEARQIAKLQWPPDLYSEDLW